MRRLAWIGMVCLLVWSGGMAGCASLIKGEGSPTTHYYLLSSLEAKQPGDEKLLRHNLRLALEPVEIPDYLARPQIVYRQGGHRLILGEMDLWAEDLDQGLARVVVENIVKLTGSDQVWRLPMKKNKGTDLHLWIQWLRFELNADGQVALMARWQLRNRGDRVYSDAAEVVGDKVDPYDKEAYVAGLSRAVADLCRKIVATIPGDYQSVGHATNP
ncbi:MAG: membrane integrity-associated transporter subunit PqiC [Magnetococcales bacterium]|nr:membrane integrity-associated transporter subunit PqiC [Magnetococcales bacterium]